MRGINSKPSKGGYCLEYFNWWGAEYSGVFFGRPQGSKCFHIQHHLIQITRIHQKYQAVLDQLQVKHRLLMKEEKNFIGQIQNKVLSLTELKNNQSKWIA